MSSKPIRLRFQTFTEESVDAISKNRFPIPPLSPIKESNHLWSPITQSSLFQQKPNLAFSQQVHLALSDHPHTDSRPSNQKVALEFYLQPNNHVPLHSVVAHHSESSRKRNISTKVTTASESKFLEGSSFRRSRLSKSRHLIPSIEINPSSNKVIARKSAFPEGGSPLRTGLSKALDIWQRQIVLDEEFRTRSRTTVTGSSGVVFKNTFLGFSTFWRWRRLKGQRSRQLIFKNNVVSDHPLNDHTVMILTAEEKPIKETIKPRLELGRPCSTSTRKAMYGTTHCSHSNDASRLVQAKPMESFSSEAAKNLKLPSKLYSFEAKVEAWRTSEPHQLHVEQPKVRHSASLPSLMSFLPRNVPTSSILSHNVAKSHPLLAPQHQAVRTKRTFRGHPTIVLQKSPWKPDRRTYFEAVVVYGRSRSLRKTRSQGDFSKMSSNFMPLVKFRRAIRMILIVLRFTSSSRERSQRLCNNQSANFLGSNWTASKSAYEMYGISFDPQDFKARREIPVSAEAKAVLSLETNKRTQHQLRLALVSLRQAVKEFSEFPITMQESLVKVGWYENFEAKRVIIRQGHTAENFYFILSGTAAVVILESDKQTGEQVPRTAAFLGRGKSFGELALMHKSRRSATVTCKDDVELLAVGREDFIDIFMHVKEGVEPEHVSFLRTVPILQEWPIHVLPLDDPTILLFTYVRRGVLLCKDSNTSTWIYVVKSGHCRVIKALRAVSPVKMSTPRELSKLDSPKSKSSLSPYPRLPNIGETKAKKVTEKAKKRGTRRRRC
ncbi:cyclic nucleotide-binding domain-containing protein 2-like isoform X3 [Biomphalaria pfeifferi]|uniref:Cyclic nucleotide-binding domain-containing protein 2-like isoform X3 n=1 Tax=Biomphalaria pfeifferi TaxID=112525 RepID=A0AAD8C1M7_BIOPF|nr:cyclic nucleotide-binding domain-containing protein 2-like isoform X3 [Biomphalaria pfeifferi]